MRAKISELSPVVPGLPAQICWPRPELRDRLIFTAVMSAPFSSFRRLHGLGSCEVYVFPRSPLDRFLVAQITGSLSWVGHSDSFTVLVVLRARSITPQVRSIMQ
jgi:hypothetical protein